MLEQVVAGEQELRGPRPRTPCPTASGPGRCRTSQRAVAERQDARRRPAGGRPAVEPPQARKARDIARSAVTTSRGMPWRSISASASSSSRSASAPKSSITGASRSSAQTSAPERRARMPTSPRWSMCWWVMTIRSRSSMRWPWARSARLELVERLAGVRPGVDQRQRVVLDQVAVDAPDGERRRDRQAVDARRLRRGAQRSRPDQVEHLVAPALHVLARDDALEVEPQQRLGVGRAHVEVPVVVVDRDAVELVDLARRSSAPRSRASWRPGRRPRS